VQEETSQNSKEPKTHVSRYGGFLPETEY